MQPDTQIYWAFSKELPTKLNVSFSFFPSRTVSHLCWVQYSTICFHEMLFEKSIFIEIALKILFKNKTAYFWTLPIFLLHLLHCSRIRHHCNATNFSIFCAHYNKHRNIWAKSDPSDVVHMKCSSSKFFGIILSLPAHSTYTNNLSLCFITI